MIPIGDSTRSRTTPYVNVAIIAAAVGVFLYELTLSTVDVNRFFLDWGVIPKQLIDWLESPSGAEEPATVFASMFMHGGWLHLIGNMLFLWVFGDNVEDAMGHVPYLLFYLLAGVGAPAARSLGCWAPTWCCPRAPQWQCSSPGCGSSGRSRCRPPSSSSSGFCSNCSTAWPRSAPPPACRQGAPCGPTSAVSSPASSSSGGFAAAGGGGRRG